MKKLFTIFLLLACGVCRGQNLFVSDYGIPSIQNLSLTCSDRCFFVSTQIANGIFAAMKTDSIGNVLWSNEIDYSNTSFSELMGIAQAVDSGFLILIDIKLSGIIPSYQTVTKLDKVGNYLWTHCYVYSSTNDPFSIIKNSDNGFMIVGGGCDGSDFVIKCNEDGGIVWQKQFVPVAGGVAFSIASHDFNRFVVAGYYGYDLIFFEIDIFGNLYWHSVISFINGGIAPWSIQPVQYGGYIATGAVKYIGGHTNDAFLAKIDSTGTLSWLKIYSAGNETIGKDLTETSDSSILMVGFADTSIWKGLIIKTDKDGNLKFAKSEVSTIYNEYHSVNYYSPSTVLLSGETTLSFLALTDTACSSLCNISSLPIQEFTPTIADTFIFYTPLNLHFIEDSLLVTNNDNALMKNILCGYTSKNEVAISNEDKIYPNPFNEKLNIFAEENEQAEIILYDILSRKLLQNIFTNSTTLNTEQLAKGIYIYELRNKNGEIQNGKVVKE